MIDIGASLAAQTVKNLPTMQETWVWSLGRKDPLQKEMATHSSILARRIPWTEESGRLQSMGSQRDGHDWSNLARTHTSLWGWCASIIAVIVSFLLFPLFFLARLLVRNETLRLYLLLVLFLFCGGRLSFSFSFSFYFLRDFHNIDFGHVCWLFVFLLYF